MRIESPFAMLSHPSPQRSENPVNERKIIWVKGDGGHSSLSQLSQHQRAQRNWGSNPSTCMSLHKVFCIYIIIIRLVILRNSWLWQLMGLWLLGLQLGSFSSCWVAVSSFNKNVLTQINTIFCLVLLLSFRVCCFWMRNWKWVGQEGREGGKELEGIETGQTIIRICYVNKSICFQLRKNPMS